MPPIRFELLAEEHLPDVLAIEKMSNGAPWSEPSFRNEIGHANGHFLVAKREGKVVGFGGVWLLVDEAHVINVAIDPNHRRQGIARNLVSELLVRSKDDGMTCATLEVRSSNDAALKLYEGLGFVQTAIRRHYYPDNKEDAIVMWLYNLDQWTRDR